MVFTYTLNDYLDNPVAINVDTIISNQKSSVFPSVSVCIKKLNNTEASVESVRSFVDKYYTEHNIPKSQQYVCYFMCVNVWLHGLDHQIEKKNYIIFTVRTSTNNFCSMPMRMCLHLVYLIYIGKWKHVRVRSTILVAWTLKPSSKWFEFIFLLSILIPFNENISFFY